jgi:hypothetical protein
MNRFDRLQGFPAVIGTSSMMGTGGYSLLTANFPNTPSAVRYSGLEIPGRVHDAVHLAHNHRVNGVTKYPGEWARANHEAFIARGIGERVIKAPLTKPRYEIRQQERTRPMDVKPFLGIGRTKQEQVTEQITEQIPVRTYSGETPLTMGDITGRSGDNQPATIIGYSLLSQGSSLMEILRDAGGRPGNTITAVSVVPPEVSDEIFRALQESPRISRDMVRYMVQDVLGIQEGIDYPDYDRFSDVMTHVQFATDVTQGPTEGIVLPLNA